jgi:hypothetical protein
MYKIFGECSLSDIWGERIVYRNLVPQDVRLLSFQRLRGGLPLRSALLPRKTDLDYAVVVTELLRRARQLDLPGGQLQQLVFIGDTRLLDGSAFHNLCLAGGWPGWAFIGRDDRTAPKSAQIEERLYLANRWSLLPEFLEFVSGEGFGLDEGTAVVIDMDKTAVGARGRNDAVIDEARLEGVRNTVAGLLGADFDEVAFRAAYGELNRPAYHAFTADNQDYLAYICLMLGAGLYDYPALVQEVQSSSLRSFDEFIRRVQQHRFELPSPGLRAIHDQVWDNFRAGDPTPFKAFRYNEYLVTAARFGGRLDEPVESAIASRAVVTQEVKQAAEWLLSRGALIFGLSDKPDEASLPTPEQAGRGMQPLHRLQTLCVGEQGE